MGSVGFKGKLEARLVEIAKLIPRATASERRSLQKERAQLEQMLQKLDS